MTSHLVVFCLGCAMISCVSYLVSGAPSAPSWPPHAVPIAPTHTCNTSEAILKLCQRCAVKSQSKIVYPMCCEGTEEAREWCSEYLNFGVHWNAQST